MKDQWLDLDGKTVIVTGGASGIGKAVAQEFLDVGANVAISDMAPEAPQMEAEEERYFYVRTDVTKASEVEQMVEDVKKRFGTVDVLVNNAGINIPRLLVDSKEPKGKYELSEAVWDKVCDVNLKGVFFCAQAVARILTEKGEGVIINMSSESGLEGSEGQSVYAATKNAVNSLTRSWAKELGKQGIRVVGVAPGIMEATGLRTIEYESALAYTRGITVDDLRAGYSKTSTTPLGRSGKLREVADLCVYLASKRASYIHGVTVNVAGGKTRG
ncbi:MAG TPA: SDR family oxidoreductase [Candidatus Anaerostipes excrementavium]|uniref:SDR family oxidoreductase n=1 Tax=Candidatus Anaerostipes excrementavium TaxID=2838463 RepID=A0A9D2BAM9_9FIRM|nr:SDR family oxidoreductase [uncultured Anaerostipes sp.]HIX68442.1 SDR family oxidoreductase [Candidatus Anaerostipes excrementavium]